MSKLGRRSYPPGADVFGINGIHCISSNCANIPAIKGQMSLQLSILGHCYTCLLRLFLSVNLIILFRESVVD